MVIAVFMKQCGDQDNTCSLFLCSSMEWWYVKCPVPRCTEEKFFNSQCGCRAWLQQHLMTSTCLVRRPRGMCAQQEKALQEATLRKVTHLEIQQLHHWQKRRGRVLQAMHAHRTTKTRSKPTPHPSAGRQMACVQVNILSPPPPTGEEYPLEKWEILQPSQKRQTVVGGARSCCSNVGPR